MNKLYNFLTECVFVFAGIILSWLFVMSIMSSSIIVIDECTLGINDNVFFTVISILTLVFVGAILYKHKKSIFGSIGVLWEKADFRHIRNVLILVSVVESVVFVFITRMQPTDDQGRLIRAVEEIKSGNYAAWGEGGYFAMWPHQNGLVLILLVLSFIFPKLYVVVFQLINCTSVGGVYYLLDRILEKKKLSKNIRLAVQVALLLFFPFRMYVTFVYGTIIGVMLSIAAIYEWVKYTEDKQKIDATLMGVYCALATVVKANYIIFIIGIIVIVLLYSMKNKSFQILTLIVVIGVFYLMSGAVTKTTIHAITGETSDNGMSSLSILAMGLHENVYRGPGWRDETHIEKYVEGLKVEGEEKRLAIGDIKSSISSFRTRERDVIDFFGRKESSIWSNPTFQGQWVNVRNGYQIKTGILSEVLLSLKTTLLIYPLLDLFLILIYMGNILYIILGVFWRERDHVPVLFYTIFLGGFIFYTISEAKSQYALPYILLLIPYGVCGLLMLIKRVALISFGEMRDCIKKMRIGGDFHYGNIITIVVCILGSILVFICGWRYRGEIKKLVCINDGQKSYERYRQYFLQNDKCIEEGIYELKSLNGGTLKVKDEEAMSSPVVLVSRYESEGDVENGGLVVSIENMNGKSMIKVCQPNTVDMSELNGFVAIDSLDGGMYTEVSSLPYCGLHDFVIVKTEDNNKTYFIKSIDDYVMTMSEDGSITMEQFQGKDNQKWILIEKQVNKSEIY